jgi:predicted nucleic acid-binding protein
MSYSLDACALIAYIDHEPGWQKVYNLINRAGAGDILLHMHIVTALEVYYGIRRDEGPDAAQEILDFVDYSAIHIIDDISVPFIREAGRLKASYRMSLADTFVYAAASRFSATVVTADGEMEPVEGIDFFYFRPPKEKKEKARRMGQVEWDQEHAARLEAERALAAATRRIAELEAR